ncbi:uncharacterized protein [Rutidosis leptorrhynchoides]|uniref:uncharacterized protein isoform X2 n=1 Tax=Rutidosis leptorrhynchoides TaxID=125765 RepID=UPI003A99F8C1
MSNLRTMFRLNHAAYSSFTCCYNRARCRPRLIVSLSNPIQNPNSIKPRLIDSSDVKNMETLLSWGAYRNHQRRMLSRSANSTDTKSPYDTLAENMLQDTQIVAEAETETEMCIYSSDDISFDPEPFKRESLRVQNSYKYGLRYIDEITGDSKILEKVQLFCEERAKIQNDNVHDETLARQKLNEFNSNFRQANQIHVLDLIIAAFELEIRSLVDLFMDDAIDIFLEMTDDEAYKILTVDLRDEYSHKVFKELSNRVLFHKWAFE